MPPCSTSRAIPCGCPGASGRQRAAARRRPDAPAPAVDRDIAEASRSWQRSARGGPAASRTYADGVHGRIWPSRPSVRRGTFLYASGFSRRRTPSARTLTTWWRWRAGSPVGITQETHAYQVPSCSVSLPAQQVADRAAGHLHDGRRPRRAGIKSVSCAATRS